MTSKMAVESRVVSIIRAQLGLDDDVQLTPDQNFVDDLGADSLDMVELIMAAEEEFDVAIPDEEAEQIKTVGKAIGFFSDPDLWQKYGY